jgi:hypothetical protein
MSEFVKYASAYDEVSHSGVDSTTWKELNNILQGTDTFATGSYTSTGKVPQQLYLYNFNLGLGENQYVKSVTFEVQLSCTNGVQAEAPVGFVNYGRSIGHNNLDYTNTIRLENNQQISNYKTVYSYTISNSQIQQYGLSKSVLNSDIFGIILQFPSNQLSKNGNVYLDWVRVKVEYENPYYVFGSEPPLATQQIYAYTMATRGYINETYHTNVGLRFTAKIQIQNMSSMRLKGGDKLVVDLPLGLHVVDVSCTRCKWDSNTSTLVLDDNGSSGVCFATFTFRGTTSGYKQVTFHGDNIGSWTRWLYITKNANIEAEADEQLFISTGECRKGAESVITVDGKTFNSDGTADFEVLLPNQPAPYKIEANLDYCDDGVTVKSIDAGNGLITFNIPSDEFAKFSFDVYFIPSKVGDASVEVVCLDNQNSYSYDYTVEYPYIYRFGFNTHDTLVEGGRLVSTVDTGAYILPCKSVDSERVVKVKKPTLAVKKFEDIDYIGCVKLKQTHYSPSSTFKDTLLNTYYKNKRYMGKKGAVDEDISLKVRLPPVDVTTVQGMIEMDKPIPINTNHKCFEGDALNHRGWAEIYSIKTERVGNNPSWYDCDIDVKYITHNMNTRFKITKGSRVSDYFLPNLLQTIYEDGSDLADSFYCSTTGTVGYNSDNVDTNRRNIVVLDEGEHFKMQTQDKLGIKCKAVLNWTSTVNTETRDNHVSRVFRLVDSVTGNSVFEYEYYDFTHDGEDHSCRVIGRLLYKDTYKVVINRKINLYNDTTEDNEGTSLFGSELVFKLMSNKLTLEDAGWSGQELSLEDIELESGEYYLEVEVNNNNQDLDANPIIHYFNFQLSDLVISNEYSPYYQNLLVSPFPVPNRDIIYTRESEDGTIFYLEDDGTECSYNLSPYYQYHTGVTLESLEGIQLVNLDNNHNVVYATNGLIRIGFNRVNGKVTLYKFDRVSQQYILVSKLQLTKFDDMNINSFTDDKLELQISDTVWTVWRGRPFVRVEHPTEDINFLDTFIRVYAERVGDTVSEYPTNFELVDDSNLLPVCVGSERLLRSDCVDVDTEEFTPSYTNLSLDLEDSTGATVTELGISQPCRFHVWSGNLNPIEEVCFVVDGEMIPAKVYLDTAAYNEGEAPNYIEYSFDEVGVHTVQALWTEVDGYDYALSDELSITVVDDTYKLTCMCKDSYYYRQGSFDFLLTQAGTPVSGKVVNINVNGLDYPVLTDEYGVASLSNRLMVGEYTVTGVFCEAISSTSVEDYDVSKATVIDAQASKTVTVKKSWSQVSVVNSSNEDITEATVEKGTYVLCYLTDTGDEKITGAVVTLTVNGVSYTRVTDTNGCARLNINLTENTYDLQVGFAGTNSYESLVRNYELVVV